MLADDQFKWFYWLGPILGFSFLAMLLSMSSGYIRKILLPKHRGRRVE